MPSPRRPSRSIVRRRKQTETAPSQPRHQGRDLATNGVMDCGIPHDAFLYALRAGFELWLDQRDHGSIRRREFQHRRQDQFQRYEAHVADQQVERRADISQTKSPRVLALEQADSRIRSQARMELAVPHVVGDHVPSATRQQDLGKTARRRADVEAELACRIDAEPVETGHELQSAPRHPRMSRRGSQHRTGPQNLRGFDNRCTVSRHASCRDGGHGLGATLEQAALDQRHIGAPSSHGFLRGSILRTPTLRSPTTVLSLRPSDDDPVRRRRDGLYRPCRARP